MAANDNSKPEIPVISLDSSGDEAVKNDSNEVSEREIREEEEDQNEDEDEDEVFNSVKSNGGCWVIEEPEKMETNENSKPEIPVISLDSCDDEAMKNVRHEGSERESREAEEEEQNEGKVFNTGISNGGGGVKEEYVYRTKAEERKILADLSSFPQLATMLAFDARMRKKSRRGNRNKRRKKQQKIESVGSNAMTNTMEEEKQMDSNTYTKTKTSLETQLVKKKGDMVLLKLLRRYELHICNGKGWLTKNVTENQSLVICLRCGDSGHDMFSCSNEYSSDVKNDQNEGSEREIREEEEQNEDKVLNNIISNGGCWVTEEPEKMAANENSKPEIRVISLDSSGDEATKNDRNERSERKSREAEEDQNEGKVFNTVISNGGGVKEEYVYRTKSEERKILADLSSFPQLTTMLAFEARMRKKSRRGNRNKRRKKQQMTESVGPNTMVDETGRIREVLETKPAMVSENDGAPRPPTHTVEEEKQMDSNTDAKTKTSLEMPLVKRKNNMVLRKLFRGPRYFDSPQSSWGMCYNCGEDDHTEANCTMRKRKKPCYICGGFTHNAKRCKQRYGLYIYNRKGCLTKVCPEKDAAEDQSLDICLRCGDSGHNMFSCSNEYSSDDLRVLNFAYSFLFRWSAFPCHQWQMV
ncbi:unnamed protein product [Ilex paraguariensis]|uniref:CCHC-type domain-containing protein n=1 Tax=Ilex paraguariensis TaxID=185542 RepID=A0ABC8R4P2_9AQUA